VKLRDLPHAFGLGSGPREYAHEVATFNLPVDGEIQFARWLHPGEGTKTITQESVNALRAFLGPGDVAIDIGAHTGDTTVPMALAVGPTGRVFALEPNPYVFKVLAANAALNRSKTDIVPLMFAAMPTDGDFEFEYSDSGYCNGGFHRGISRWRHGHFSKLRVAGRNLRDYLRAEAPDAVARLRYIKIDTEGFDRSVVQSLAGLIATARPHLRAEIYKHLPREERRRFYDDLRTLGYRIFKCEEDVYRGRELGPADLSQWPHFDIFAVPEQP
jgi:FkbM family methyltransferase